VELATLTVDPVTKKPKSKIYCPAEVDALLKRHDLAKKDKDAEIKIT
jgi:20S proteasome subunit alpha 3